MNRLLPYRPQKAYTTATRSWLLVIIFLLGYQSSYAQFDSNISVDTKYKEELEALQEQFELIKEDSLAALDHLERRYEAEKEGVKERWKARPEARRYTAMQQAYDEQLNAYDQKIEAVKEHKHSIDWDQLKQLFVAHHQQGVELAELSKEYELAEELKRSYDEYAGQWAELDTLSQIDTTAVKAEAERRGLAYADELSDGRASQVSQLGPLSNDKDSLSSFAKERLSTAQEEAVTTLEQEATQRGEQLLREGGLQEVNADQLQAQTFGEGQLVQFAEPIKSERVLAMIEERTELTSARTALSQHTAELTQAYEQVRDVQQREVVLGTYDSIDRLQLSFEDRFVYGGNLQLQLGDITHVDLSPWVGWKAAEKLLLGGGVTYRTDFHFGDVEEEELDFGPAARVFGEFTFFRGYYLHVEGERFWGKSQEGELLSNVSTTNLLAGIGKTITLKGKLKSNLHILYNLTHDKNEPYPSPWVVRFGVMIK
ncbi:MAG: hypothetical protein RIF33_08420 [Cyclobacteriaceae bacterium]